MTLQTLKFLGVSTLGAALLAACGGGGGDSPQATTPTPNATTFALAAGYKARVASGATDNFSITGTGSCTGTATISTAPSVAATFEGVAGYSSAQVSTVNYSNCTLPSNVSTGTSYYNLSVVPIGLTVTGSEYAKFVAAPALLPAAAKVNDSAVVVTMNSYTDSSKLIPIGQRVVSYAIEADTNATAIFNLIIRSYDQGGALLSTEQSRYRMAESGALTIVSIDVQFSTTSQLHLVFTRT